MDLDYIFDCLYDIGIFICVIISLVYCFFGYKIFKLFLCTSSFLGYTLVGFFIFGFTSSDEGVVILGSLIFGIIGALLSYYLYKLNIFLIFSIVTFLFLSIFIRDTSIALLLGILVGILSFIAEKYVIISVTSIVGGFVSAIILNLCIDIFDSPLGLLVGILLSILGFVYQCEGNKVKLNKMPLYRSSKYVQTQMQTPTINGEQLVFADVENFNTHNKQPIDDYNYNRIMKTKNIHSEILESISLYIKNFFMYIYTQILKLVEFTKIKILELKSKYINEETKKYIEVKLINTFETIKSFCIHNKKKISITIGTLGLIVCISTISYNFLFNSKLELSYNVPGTEDYYNNIFIPANKGHAVLKQSSDSYDMVDYGIEGASINFNLENTGSKSIEGANINIKFNNIIVPNYETTTDWFEVNYDYLSGYTKEIGWTNPIDSPIEPGIPMLVYLDLSSSKIIGEKPSLEVTVSNDNFKPKKFTIPIVLE